MCVFLCVCVRARASACVGERDVLVCVHVGERGREREGRESVCQWVCVKTCLDIFYSAFSPIILRKTTYYNVKFYIYVFIS